MKQTWLVKKTKNLNNSFLFIFLFFKKTNISNYKIFYTNFLFFKNCSNMLLNNNLFNSSIFKKIEFKLLFVEKKKLFPIEKLTTFEDNPLSSFQFNKNKLIYKFLNAFFFINSTIFSINTNKTAFFNFFYFTEKKSQITVINIQKIIFRWEFTFDFLFNIFFYKKNPLMFSGPLFKKQTLSFNWISHNWEQILWRYYFNFFVFKFNKNTKKFNFFCLKLQEMDIDFFIISDVNYHFKNLYFFRDFKFYTLGLVPLSTNPWIVNYPIPSVHTHFLMQLFFFKLLIFTKKNSILQQYFFYKRFLNNF